MSTPPRERRWTHDAIVTAANLWREATGDWPTKNDWNPSMRRRHIDRLLKLIAGHREGIRLFESGDFPSDWVVRREWGSWNAFIAFLGSEPRPAGRQPREITEQRVRELRLAHGETAPPAGPALLKRALEHVVEAQKERDPMALRGSLYELAAVAVAWMDAIDAHPDREAA